MKAIEVSTLRVSGGPVSLYRNDLDRLLATLSEHGVKRVIIRDNDYLYEDLEELAKTRGKVISEVSLEVGDPRTIELQFRKNGTVWGYANERASWAALEESRLYINERGSRWVSWLSWKAHTVISLGLVVAGFLTILPPAGNSHPRLGLGMSLAGLVLFLTTFQFPYLLQHRIVLVPKHEYEGGSLTKYLPRVIERLLTGGLLLYLGWWLGQK